jgi:hypothetical protein
MPIFDLNEVTGDRWDHWLGPVNCQPVNRQPVNR